jgi:hypothetical protein
VGTWTFIWLVVFLKLPLLALFLLVRWAVRQAPDTASEEDGGIGPRPRPAHPHRPHSRLPRSPRRGPHGDPAPAAPSRVRTHAAHRRVLRG